MIGEGFASAETPANGHQEQDFSERAIRVKYPTRHFDREYVIGCAHHTQPGQNSLASGH
jgi:hypothetical protein